MPAVVNQQNVAVGSEFWLSKKGIVSSTIVTGGVDLTGVAQGDVAITEIILQTDATGLATGTNLQFQTNNADGAAVFAATVISGLGANKTVDLVNFSTTSKYHAIVNSGSKVQLSCTGSNCTGSGVVDVYLKCVRITSGASLS